MGFRRRGSRHAIALLVAIVGCSGCSSDNEPVFPRFIGTDHGSCERCRPKPGGACEALFRFGCGGVADGGTCGTEVPCAPECCAEGSPKVGTLDEAPWKDVVARARTAADPEGHVAFVHRGADGAAIWAVPAAGGEPLQITVPDRSLSDALWSPSGRHVAFVCKEARRLLSLDLEREAYHAYREPPAAGTVPLVWAGDRLLSRSIARDGAIVSADPSDPLHQLLGVSDYTPFNGDVSYSFDGSRWASVTSQQVSIGTDAGGSPLLFKAPPTGIARLSWHPSAEFLAFWLGEYTEVQIRHRLVFATLDGKTIAPTDLIVDTAANPDQTVLDYVFSPDGLFIAYAVPRDAGTLEIRVASIDSMLDAETIATAANPPGLGFIPADLEPQLQSLAAAPLPGPSTAKPTPHPRPTSETTPDPGH